MCIFRETSTGAIFKIVGERKVERRSELG